MLYEVLLDSCSSIGRTDYESRWTKDQYYESFFRLRFVFPKKLATFVVSSNTTTTMTSNSNRPESIDWIQVAALGYKRATRLRTLEHVLINHPEGIDPESLCVLIGLVGSAKIRTLQNDLNELRRLYIGKQFISHAPYRLVLGGDDLAFPEAEFNANDRKQLNALCRLIAFLMAPSQ